MQIMKGSYLISGGAGLTKHTFFFLHNHKSMYMVIMMTCFSLCLCCCNFNKDDGELKESFGMMLTSITLQYNNDNDKVTLTVLCRF